MLDTDLKAIQQINFTGNLDQDGGITMFMKQKKLFLIFHMKLWKYCSFIMLEYQYKMAQYNTSCLKL